MSTLTSLLLVCLAVWIQSDPIAGEDFRCFECTYTYPEANTACLSHPDTGNLVECNVTRICYTESTWDKGNDRWSAVKRGCQDVSEECFDYNDTYVRIDPCTDTYCNQNSLNGTVEDGTGCVAATTTTTTTTTTTISTTTEGGAVGLMGAMWLVLGAGVMAMVA